MELFSEELFTGWSKIPTSFSDFIGPVIKKLGGAVMFWFGFILGAIAGANVGVVVFGALLNATRANAALQSSCRRCTQRVKARSGRLLRATGGRLALPHRPAFAPF